METYYHPQDLPKFEEIGEGAPELAKKFFDYYAAVFAEGELHRQKNIVVGCSPKTIELDTFQLFLILHPWCNK